MGRRRLTSVLSLRITALLWSGSMCSPKFECGPITPKMMVLEVLRSWMEPSWVRPGLGKKTHKAPSPSTRGGQRDGPSYGPRRGPRQALTLDLQPPEQWEKNVCSLQATQPVLFCYSKMRRIIQMVLSAMERNKAAQCWERVYNFKFDGWCRPDRGDS